MEVLKILKILGIMVVALLGLVYGAAWIIQTRLDRVIELLTELLKEARREK